MKWFDIIFGAYVLDFFQSKRDEANRVAAEAQKQQDQQIKNIRDFVRLNKELRKK